MSDSRIEIIDYFKGVSIIAIFLCHLVQAFELPSFVSDITSFGRMGCQMFFVVSGYTTALSYDKNNPSLITFYKKRWLSLAPGYWLSLLVTIILALITVHVSGANLLGTSLKTGDIFINFLLLNGLVPTQANNLVFRGGWFVGSLFILYTLYPIMQFGYKKYGSIFLSLSIAAACIISAMSLIATGEINSGCGGFLYYSFVNQMPPFVLGIMIYHNVISGNKAKIKSLLFFVLSFVLFYVPICPFRAVCVPFFFSISFTYLLIALRNKKLYFSNLLCSVGKLSYPFYLLHIFFIWDIPQLIIKPLFPLKATACIIWAILSFCMVYFASIAYNKLIRLISNRLQNIFELC